MARSEVNGLSKNRKQGGVGSMYTVKNKKDESTLVADEEEAYGFILDKVAAKGPIFSDDDVESHETANDYR
jgi:hypothetical protein